MTSPDTVLVTGGAGFIGSTLVDRLLAEGRRVIAVDDLSTGRLTNLVEARANAGQFEFQRLDITAGGLESVVRRHRPQVIVHLAAQISVTASVDDPAGDAATNVLGTIAVLEAARRNDVEKVVFATSAAVYGAVRESELPVDEGNLGVPASAYGAAKLAAETYIASWGAQYGLDWTSLAFANVYGPRQDPAGEAGVVAIFLDRMLAGAPCTIHGDGEQSRDFVFVDDVVHAIALSLDRGGGQRFNVGTGVRTSVNRLFAALRSALDYPHQPVMGPARAGEVRHLTLDASRAAAELGWKPWTSIEEGLAATIEWARAD